MSVNAAQRENVDAMVGASRAIVLGLAAVSFFSSCGGERAPEPQARPPVAVEVVATAFVDTAERLEAGGVVTAPESAVVSSRIVATILAVRVKAGDPVAPGDPLVVLDAQASTELTRQASAAAVAAEKALAQARTAMAAAEAEHKLAAAWHGRITALYARDSATGQERDEAEARLATAQAHVAGATAGIEAADASLASARAAARAAEATESLATVRAPFAGLVTERLTDPGNLAAPGVPLLRIESGGARQVVARVDEARAVHLDVGDRVEVSIEAAEDPSARETIVEGRVSEVARTIVADQRAFAVKVVLPPGVTARTGTFARVLFPGATRRALFVPADAVRRQGQVASVFMVEEGVARLRLVQTGAVLSQGVEVLAGLEAGESVVTAPPLGLADGTPVAVAGATDRPGGVR
jgi:RND family efflux transporter MFP subunit